MALNVLDFGAVPNGTTDNTAAFQAALDTAGDSSNTESTVVYAPAGRYGIHGTLRVPGNVTLAGDWQAPAYSPPNTSGMPGVKGTILLAFAGAGNEDAEPFITLTAHAAGVKGLAVYYPEQKPDVQPYPPTIRGGVHTPNNTFFDNLTVQDCLLVNPYHGVDFARYRCGRHLIRGLYGQPLRIGIGVDGCLDIGRIENVHFWPFWQDTDQVKTYTGIYGTALVMRRSDWQIVHNFFGLGYHSGILFGHGLHQNPENPLHPFEGGCNGHFSNINFDAADVGLDIYTTSGAGVHVSNLNVACTNEYGHSIRCAIWAHTHGEGMPDDLPVSALSVQSGSFWGQFGDQIILWEKGGPLHLSSSIFRSAPIRRAAVVLTGGEAIVTGNTFAVNDHPCAVEIGKEIDGAIVAHNLLRGHRIDKRSGKSKVKHNLP